MLKAIICCRFDTVNDSERYYCWCWLSKLLIRSNQIGVLDLLPEIALSVLFSFSEIERILMLVGGSGG